MKKYLLTLIMGAVLLGEVSATAQLQTLKEVSDSLGVLLRERTGVKGSVSITRIDENKKSISVVFSKTLKDWSWNKEKHKWLEKELASLLPPKYKGRKIKSIITDGVNLKSLYDYPVRKKYKDTRKSFVREVGGPEFDRGLSGRIISLWQSHGLYYNEAQDRWRFQRAPVFTTVEDLYTQSYVQEFLAPMLRNAGAYLVGPREMSYQLNEIIVDNDPSFSRDSAPENIRLSGTYSEEGAWSKYETEGFADSLICYRPGENPFKMGTSRFTNCVKEEADARAVWTFCVPESGEYPVYVAYNSDENSTKSAHYTVNAADGQTAFIVDQSMNGSSWTYLGTFPFSEGISYSVSLDNGTPKGHKYEAKSIVSADAVRIGAGVGKIIRGPKDSPRESWSTSGAPAYVEAAIYNMLWNGCDSTFFDDWDDEYTKDYASRGKWTRTRDIPVDLSFAFHTDAGTTPGDEIIGTLAIYTYKEEEGIVNYKDGNSRIQGRHLAELVQDEICRTIESEFEPEWKRRFLWDRSYSESRTTGVPGMLLELLSHQNFADMRYGLDPVFRFKVSRAIYKGILRFLSEYYNTAYVVQPLPANSFSVALDGEDALLRWKATEDPYEPSAEAKDFLVQVRKGDGLWGKMEVLKANKDGEWYSARMPIEERGVLYSYKLSCRNRGGLSFPTEVLCAGLPESSDAREVLVVNNFTRLGVPVWYDNGENAGFESAKESGVGYGAEGLFIGSQYDFTRADKWISDDEPGWGASYLNMVGKPIAGNTFDYVSLHANAILELGYKLSSASSEAFANGAEGEKKFFAIDVLCGKQTATPVGRAALPARHYLLPEALKDEIRNSTLRGSNIIISGSYIASEFVKGVYDDGFADNSFARNDSTYRSEGISFCNEVLGYGMGSLHPCGSNELILASEENAWGRAYKSSYNDKFSGKMYRVEQVNGINPSKQVLKSRVAARYDSGLSAGLWCEMDGYKTACYGFPIETLDSMDAIKTVLGESLCFFSKE